MRIFVGIDIDEQIRQRIYEFGQQMRELAPDARWVKPETFHVTLKFLGEAPSEMVERVKQALAAVGGSQVNIGFEGAGFFPNARSARVFWVGVKADDALRQLARHVDEATAQLGFSREENAYKPHLTLARAGKAASGNPHQKGSSRGGSRLAALAKKLEAISQPSFGTIAAQEFFLYESKLSPAGARYTKIARFGLEAPNC
jgi:RNA 2',3'-cyclic 3'-phosphodiesterase